MRVLVTGSTGFTGRHILQELSGPEFEVITLDRENAGRKYGYSVNLLDPEKTAGALAVIQPQAVIHLAAISHVEHDDAREIYSTNVVATRNLLSGLSNMRTSPSIVILASSANVYGNNTGLICESSPLQPQNDYAISKMAMEHMAGLWSDRLPICIVRPFNYTGVGQSTKFLIPKIIAAFQKREEFLELGNTDVSRDFTDVRDVAKIYRKLLEQRPVGQTLNLCSGNSYSLCEIVKITAKLSGHHISIRQNPTLMRGNEVVRLAGDNNKLRTLIGSYSFTPIAETINWMLSRYP